MIALVATFAFFADSLYADGNYYRAQIEYKRLIYNNSIDSIDGYYKVSKCFFHLDNIQKSILYAEKLPDTFSAYRSLLYFWGENYAMCRENAEQTDSMLDVEAIAFLLEGSIAQADNFAIQSADSTVLQIVSDVRSMHWASGKKVSRYSYILPGAGLLLAGKPVRALLSLMYTAGSAYLTYSAFHSKRYVDASLIYMFALSRFYFGGVDAAARAAEKRNKLNMESLRHKALFHFLVKYHTILD